MPPKRKEPGESTPPKKKLKFTRVLSPTSYAVKQSSPRKTRGGTKLGGVMGPNLTIANTTSTSTKSTSTNTNANANANAGVKAATRKAREVDEGTIVIRSPSSFQAAPPPPPPQSAATSAVLPKGTRSQPQPPIPSDADKAVADAVAQTLAPTVKTRSTKNSKLIGANDENSPFLTFRAVPKPSRKAAASAGTATRATRKAPAVPQLPPPAPQPQLPPQVSTDNIFDNVTSEDDLSRAKQTPFLSSLKKAAPQPPNPVLTSMTSHVVNSTTGNTTERDVFVNANPTTPSRRGRGRGRGRGGRTATSTREAPAVAPPAFVLPASTQGDATDDDELNTAAAPVPQPKARRGRKPAAAIAASGTREPLPTVSSAELAPPPPSARGRGGRGRGRARGSAGATRGGHTGQEAVVQFAPIPPPESTIQSSTTSSYSETSAGPLTIAQAITLAAARKPRSTFSGPVTERGVKLLKKHVLGKLSGRGKKNLVGFEDEYGHVHHLLEQTVVSGEGNSMLIIGPRGVGKSTLVETAIQSLQEEHKGEFLVVRLNGFLQTDDKLALREIWRQLGVEMDLEEQGGQPKTSNFADTLTSILALLSHPDELEANADGDDINGGGGGRKTSLSVVFVLDEFDLFVTHPRQTLLYNLFDIAQARKAPIAVLGLTSRVDVVEGLEKRVKSRFSHRSVHLRLPNSLEQFWNIVRSGLLVDEDELSEGRRKGAVGEEEKGYWEKWNENLEALFEESKGFRMLLRRQFALSKDVKGFWASYCLYPIAHLVGVKSPYLTEEMVVLGTATTTSTKEKDGLYNLPSISLSGPENRLHILPALTELELSLLIAAARLDIISDTDTCNFNMAYEEYKSLASKVKVQNSIGSTIAGGGVPGGGQGGKLWSREVAVGAWEGLGRWEVLVPATGGGGVGGGSAGQTSQGGVGREGRMWRVDVGLNEIGRFAGGQGGVLGGVLGKWCREI